MGKNFSNPVHPNVKKWAEWLTRNILGDWQDRDYENPPVKIELRRVQAEGAVSSVSTKKIKDSDLRELLNLDPSAEYIEGFLQDAQEDANLFGTVSVYRLEVFLEDGESFMSRPIRLRGENEDFEGTEPANQKGVTAQLMRHSEVQQRTIMALVESMTRSNIEKDRLIGKHYETHMHMVQEMENAISQRHERELETKMLAAKEDRKDAALRSFVQLAPVVINKLKSGGDAPAAPTGKDPRLENVKNLVANLSREDMARIIQSLPPEKQVLLIATLGDFMQEIENDETAHSGNGRANH